MVSRRLLRIKVLKSFFSYLKSESTSPTNVEKEVAFSIQKTYDLYHYLLLLLLEIADFAQQRIDLNKQKFLATEEEKNPNTKFVDNKVITLLRENEALKKYVQRSKLSWINSPELIKQIYNQLVASEYYKQYMSEPSRTFDQDKRLIIDIILNELEDCQELYDILEEQSIFWVDDVEFALSMIVKTIRLFKANQPKYTELLPLYKNDDDQSFAIRLLRRAMNEHKNYIPLIEQYTKNWEVERIAFMDSVLLELAIAESIEFPNIPIKVTIDEYIELSKYFSTLNSATFINGMLDKIIQHLIKESKVVKSGRGLVS
ncbi:MAG: transcription antitermination protein NusB [Prevotellaceae bacterium]|jgi:N utilization substance protein B|nr:transcription antitermination protein NusB [Prevotellaceae bacterium]